MKSFTTADWLPPAGAAEILIEREISAAEARCELTALSHDLACSTIGYRVSGGSERPAPERSEKWN